MKLRTKQLRELNHRDYWFYPPDRGLVGWNADRVPENYETHVCPYCGRTSHCKELPPPHPLPPAPCPHHCSCAQPQEEVSIPVPALEQYYRPTQYYNGYPQYPYYDYRYCVTPYLPNYYVPLCTEWLAEERDR